MVDDADSFTKACMQVRTLLMGANITPGMHLGTLLAVASTVICDLSEGEFDEEIATSCAQELINSYKRACTFVTQHSVTLN